MNKNNIMTKQEKIRAAWQRVTDRLTSINQTIPDAQVSPMSSRTLFAEAKELVGEAAVLMALLNLDDETVAVEARLWEWERVEPDHWVARVGGTNLVLEAWIDGNWKVFNGSRSPGYPTREGQCSNLDEAIREAEKALLNLFT